MRLSELRRTCMNPKRCFYLAQIRVFDDWVLSHLWVSHVSCEWVVSPMKQTWYECEKVCLFGTDSCLWWMGFIAIMSESCLSCEWVMSFMNESCRTHEWVMSHVNGSCLLWKRHTMNPKVYLFGTDSGLLWMSHVAHMTESCLIWMGHVFDDRVIVWIQKGVSILVHRGVSFIHGSCCTHEWIVSHTKTPRLLY